MKPTFVPNPDTQKVYADISAQEVAASGPYVAGGITLTTRAQSYDAANDRTNLTADDTVIGPGFTGDSAYAVVYDSSGAKPLWSLVDFEGTKSVAAGTLTIDWASLALLYIVAI